MARRMAVVALVLSLAVVAGYSRALLDGISGDSAHPQELLYLPNGKYLKVMSLGHAGLVADLFYLWAIQYYSNYERTDRRRYVEHVFGNVITELDPHYVDAYWLGALILILETGDVDAGIGLLERGANRNPDQWILPYLAGWECYHAKRYERATSYFERASRVPGAPTAVRRMKASLAARTGSPAEALAVWKAILEDPASDSLSVKIARRKIRELQTRLDIELLEAAVGRFRIDNGRSPGSLEELLRRSYIARLPRDADDRDYVYDPTTGRVSSPAGRVLGGR